MIKFIQYIEKTKNVREEWLYEKVCCLIKRNQYQWQKQNSDV